MKTIKKIIEFILKFLGLHKEDVKEITVNDAEEVSTKNVWSVKKGKYVCGIDPYEVPDLDISEEEIEKTSTLEEEPRIGRFEVKRNVKGDFHFNLLAGTFKVVLTSEMYKTKQSALKGIASVKANSKKLKAFDMRVSKDGKDYFVLRARNNKIIGVSEMYESNQMMRKGIQSVMANAPDAYIYEISRDAYTKID